MTAIESVGLSALLKRGREVAREAARRGRALLFPPICASCGDAIFDSADELCRDCWATLSLAVGHTYCGSCGEDRHNYLLPNGRCTKCAVGGGPNRFDGFVRVGRYEGSLRRLILSFKHRFVLDGLLGGLLAEAFMGRLDPAQVDLWVPVPAHWRRRLTVGYQPTALLAKVVAGRCGGLVRPVLTATRYVAPFHTQAGLSAKLRAEAIRGVFRVARGCNLAGRTVCIVDDVTTTGATLREARRVLRAAGASKILAAVLAKTIP